MPTVPLVAQKALASYIETCVPTLPLVAQKALASFLPFLVHFIF